MRHDGAKTRALKLIKLWEDLDVQKGYLYDLQNCSRTSADYKQVALLFQHEPNASKKTRISICIRKKQLSYRRRIRNLKDKVSVLETDEPVL